jgi:hypothetical protein
MRQVEKSLAGPELAVFFRNNWVAADGDKATEKLKLGSQNPETVVMGPRFVNLFILSDHDGTECL